MRILLVRTSALGDIVHSLPVLIALRRQLPESRIGWVVEEAFAPLLAGHPALDELITVRLRPWRRRPLAGDTRRELAAARSRLGGFSAEVAVDLMGNHKGGALAWLSGARRRLGAPRRQRREPSSAVWLNDTPAVSGTHAVDRALSLVRPLLASDPAVDFGGDLLPEAPAEALAARLGAEPLPPVLVQPGAGWGSKRWPPERWGAVAAELGAHTGGSVGVLAAPGEEPLAAAVVAAAAGRALALPALGLLELMAALRRASLVLGGDTGPVHLAHALGTPVVMLMGPTDPQRHGPWGAPEAALAHRLPCGFCYKRFAETKACLLQILPHHVAAAARSRLSSAP